MTILLLDRFYSDDSNALWSASVRLGWDVHRNGSFYPTVLSGDLVFYMGTDRSLPIAKELGYELISPPLDWLCHLPEEYLARKVKSMTWGEAKVSEVSGFYKPADDKWFQAKVYSSGKEIVACSDEVLETEVVIWSEPVVFEREYRFFIRDRVPMTGSQYAVNGRLSRTDDGYTHNQEEYESALSFVSDLCKDERIQIPASLVIDIGILNTGEWACTEANPSYCAGIYGSEPLQALLTIQSASKKTNQQ